jgi:hypothetical protein
MEDLIIKFMELLRFMPYIKEKRVKSHRVLSFLPRSYKDVIEFDNPKTLNKVL